MIRSVISVDMYLASEAVWINLKKLLFPGIICEPENASG